MTSSLPPIDLEKHERVETATFCLGCFWGPDGQFGAMDGVIRTRVGYAGGTMPDPTYHNIGDHIESLEIDFDLDKLSFEEIVSVFWKNHNPISPFWKRQYAKAIFFHNEKQKKIILNSKQKLEKELKEQITTEIIPYERFYQAENYHQKYHLQNHTALLADFKKIFTNMQQFVDSTASARVNGYINGYGTAINFDKDIERLGLEQSSVDILKHQYFEYKKKAV